MTPSNEAQSGDVQIGGKKLSGLVDGATEDEEVEVLGYASFFTIGEFLEVPVQFVKGTAEELGISEDVLPNEPTPKKAYTNTCQRLFWGLNNNRNGMFGEYEVRIEKIDTGEHIAFVQWLDDEADEIPKETIGNLEYDYDNQTLNTFQRTTEPDKLEVWEQVEEMAHSKFEEMLETWTGSDLRSMVRNLISATFSVRLRNAGAVYFVPAGQEDELRAASELMDACNQFKKPGRPRAEVALLEVIDTEEKRRLIQSRAEAELQEAIDSAVENAIEMLEDESDDLAQEAVEELVEGLEETNEVAVQYNALLNAEMKATEWMEEWKEDLNETKQEAIEQAMEEVDLREVTTSEGELEDLTKDELYELAQEEDVDGRSDMTKDELVEALQ